MGLAAVIFWSMRSGVSMPRWVWVAIYLELILETPRTIAFFSTLFGAE
jgi:hypothetical protein